MQQDVLGFDVPVDDALPVGIVERARDLDREPDRFVDGKFLLAGEAIPERFARDEGHHIVEEAVNLSRIEQREDVGMLEVRGGSDFGEESLAPDHRREFGAEEFESHVAIMTEVAGPIDGGHAAGAELVGNQVSVTQCGGEAGDGRWHRSKVPLTALASQPTRILRGGFPTTYDFAISRNWDVTPDGRQFVFTLTDAVYLRNRAGMLAGGELRIVTDFIAMVRASPKKP